MLEGNTTAALLRALISVRVHSASGGSRAVGTSAGSVEAAPEEGGGGIGAAIAGAPPLSPTFARRSSTVPSSTTALVFFFPLITSLPMRRLFTYKFRAA